jgi:phage FluMu protein gp41
MITEKGTLIIGIEYEGKIHKEFELRPQIVRDSIDAAEDDRAKRNDSYLGLCVLAKQIIKLGDIPKEKITAELLMNMYEVDLAVISEASRRLQKRLQSFRGEDKAIKEVSAGNA